MQDKINRCLELQRLAAIAKDNWLAANIYGTNKREATDQFYAAALASSRAAATLQREMGGNKWYGLINGHHCLIEVKHNFIFGHKLHVESN